MLGALSPFAAAPARAQQPAEPTLTGLSLSVGGNAVTLNPAFAGSTTSYTATVPHDATSVSATATWTDPAKVEASAYDTVREFVLANYKDNPISSSGGSATVNLAASGNTRVRLRATRTDVANNPPARVYLIVVSKASPPPRPTVSLSASPNSVTEGQWLGVTACLKDGSGLRAVVPTGTVRIPVVVSHGTSENGDWGISLSGHTNGRLPIRTGYSIPIDGSIQRSCGVVALPTHQDSDGDNETFTVALGALPSGLTAGATTSVEVTIKDLRPRSLVTLRAVRNTVAEGSPVRLQVTLTKPLANAVEIPLVVTWDTSEPGDRGFLRGIRINAGSTSGSGTIKTYADNDPDDERFTVAVDTRNLPSGVAVDTTNLPSGAVDTTGLDVDPTSAIVAASTSTVVTVTIVDNANPRLRDLQMNTGN